MNQSRIFLSTPDVGEVKEKRAQDAIKSGWVAPIGPGIEQFEQTIAFLAVPTFARNESFGTAALNLGLVAPGV